MKYTNPRNPNSSYWQNTIKSAYFVTGAVTLGTLVTGLANDNDEIKHNAYESLLNLSITTAITYGLKSVINRERPADRYPGEVFVTSPLHGKSFPSGHTSTAFSTAATLSIEYKNGTSPSQRTCRTQVLGIPGCIWEGTILRTYWGGPL